MRVPVEHFGNWLDQRNFNVEVYRLKFRRLSGTVIEGETAVDGGRLRLIFRIHAQGRIQRYPEVGRRAPYARNTRPPMIYFEQGSPLFVHGISRNPDGSFLVVCTTTGPIEIR